MTKNQLMLLLEVARAIGVDARAGRTFPDLHKFYLRVVDEAAEEQHKEDLLKRG